jgi:hypothetical protein
MRLTYITTAAIVFALGIATASAAAAGDSSTAPAVLPNPDEQQLIEQSQPAAAPQAATGTVQPNPDEQPAARSAPAVIVHTTAPNNGFDWGDAAIGAVAALGLSAIGGAGALTITQRRARRSTGAAG